jgi:hypothetical protein
VISVILIVGNCKFVKKSTNFDILGPRLTLIFEKVFVTISTTTKNLKKTERVTNKVVDATEAIVSGSRLGFLIISWIGGSSFVVSLLFSKNSF